MRIAVAQTPGTQLTDWRATLQQIEHLITEAAAKHAELVILPECAWPAYCLGSRQAYDAARATGLPAPNLLLDRMREAARHAGLFLCVGYVEETQSRLFNSASLIGPTGELLGTHRKCFLWDFDHDYFTPGNCIEPIPTPLGKIGVMICADARLPEVPATLAARGAELILQPTGWVNAGSAAALWNPQPDFMIADRAREFGTPIASASKWGQEGDTTFVGSSLICDAAGQVQVRCPESQTVVEVADVQLGQRRRAVATNTEGTLLLDHNPPTPPPATAGIISVLAISNPGCRQLELYANEPGRSSTPLAAFAVTAGNEKPAAYIAPQDDLINLDGGCIGTLPASKLAHFAPVRCLALRGAHLVVVFGVAEPTGTLRTRACENRVFVLGINEAGWVAIAPSGAILNVATWSTTNPPPRRIVLDLRQAADKYVAHQTNVLADRVPSSYVL